MKRKIIILYIIHVLIIYIYIYILNVFMYNFKKSILRTKTNTKIDTKIIEAYLF